MLILSQNIIFQKVFSTLPDLQRYNVNIVFSIISYLIKGMIITFKKVDIDVVPGSITLLFHIILTSHGVRLYFMCLVVRGMTRISRPCDAARFGIVVNRNITWPSVCQTSQIAYRQAYKSCLIVVPEFWVIYFYIQYNVAITSPKRVANADIQIKPDLK